MQPIDFVIPWVDGNDPQWRKEKDLYAANVSSGNEEARFRDWDELKYMFRGIEKNAPWVNRIHFVTWGHIPEWLNTNHPKLHIVRHSDYIPKEYLPTFSSQTIELNMHRIPELSEHFVYINDDMLIVRPVEETDFFKNGLPRAAAGLDVIKDVSPSFASRLYEDNVLIGKNFHIKEVLRKHFWKFVNPKYGISRNLRTLLLFPFCQFYDFPLLFFTHGPNAFLKSTLEEVWSKEEQKLSETCSHKFRSFDNVNQYIFMWWQSCKGEFVPQSPHKTVKYIHVQSSYEDLINIITNCKQPFLTINDKGEFTKAEFEETKAVINGALDTILGEKSQFELF